MKNQSLLWSYILSILLVGIFAGVLFAAAIAISPSLKQVDASIFITIKQSQIKVLQVWMSTITTIYALITLYILYVTKKAGNKKAFNFTLAALLLVVAALVYSAFTDIPYNQEILSWTAGNPPANWSDIRDKWDFANVVRTVPVVLAFILQIIGLGYAKEK